MKETTTIQLSRETHEKLGELKIIERETYEGVINRLIERFENEND